MRRQSEVGRSLATCALVLWSVSACGAGSGGGMSPAVTGPSAGLATGVMSSSSSGAGGSVADCTKATRVMIAERVSAGGADTYSFNPAQITIMRGGYLAITNGSDEVHALGSVPDAGIVSSVIDKKERQVIQFPRAGTFTLQSTDARHRAVLRLTVSGESGCATPQPTLTVTGSAASGYAMSPKALTVQKTINFTVINKSDATHTVMCAPDPGGNGDNATLDQDETQVLAFDRPGRYICASTQHAAAKVTITVNSN
jgi:plastocyanin